VALRAFCLGVCALQRETGKAPVVKLRVLPLVERMALLTLHWEIGGKVVWTLGSLKITLVTCDALRAQADIESGRRPGMARLALHRGVGPEQRKPIAVIAKLLHRFTPSANRVALLAALAELLTVDVCMAVGAFNAHVLEGHAVMAVGTSNRLMAAAQGIGCFRVVVELGNRSDRLPTRCRVTVLARDVQVAVRIADAPPLAGLRREDCGRQQK
jgi:hypothetical protein